MDIRSKLYQFVTEAAKRTSKKPAAKKPAAGKAAAKKPAAKAPPKNSATKPTAKRTRKPKEPEVKKPSERLLLKINNPASITDLLPEEIAVLPDDRLKRLLAEFNRLKKPGVLSDANTRKNMRKLAAVVKQALAARRGEPYDSDDEDFEFLPDTPAPPPERKADKFADKKASEQSALVAKAVAALKPRLVVDTTELVDSKNMLFRSLIQDGKVDDLAFASMRQTMQASLSRTSKVKVIGLAVVIDKGKAYLQTRISAATKD